MNMKYIDLRHAGGQLTILGGALSLPTSDNTVPGTITTGSIRYNISSERIEVWTGSSWINLQLWAPSVSLSRAPQAGEVLFTMIMPYTASLPSGLTGSLGGCDIAPTSTSIFSLTKNNTQVGTCIIASGSNTATFVSPSAITLSQGDIIRLISPSIADATLSGPYFTFTGGR